MRLRPALLALTLLSACDVDGRDVVQVVDRHEQGRTERERIALQRDLTLRTMDLTEGGARRDHELDRDLQRHALTMDAADQALERDIQRLDEVAVTASGLSDEEARRTMDLYDRQLEHLQPVARTTSEAPATPAHRSHRDPHHPAPCTVTSDPPDAAVMEEDFFGEFQFVGRTPLVIERPPFHSRAIRIVEDGFEDGEEHLLSQRVHTPCEVHVVLDPR